MSFDCDRIEVYQREFEDDFLDFIQKLRIFAGRSYHLWKTKAFEILRKALEKKAVSLTNLVYDPKFDEIKKDAEFAELMKQNNLSLSPPQF